MAHQGTILQLVEAHWGTLDGLSCITVVESTRKVQTLPTNLNTITALNTQLNTHPIAQVFANYQWKESCSAWNMPAVALLVQQTLPTNLNTITAPNTHLHTYPIAQVFAKTINGKLLAPPGICQLYLF